MDSRLVERELHGRLQLERMEVCHDAEQTCLTLETLHSAHPQVGLRQVHERQTTQQRALQLERQLERQQQSPE